MFPRNPCGGAVHHFSCRSHYMSHYLFHCFISCPPPTLGACKTFFISSAPLSVFCNCHVTPVTRRLFTYFNKLYSRELHAAHSFLALGSPNTLSPLWSTLLHVLCVTCHCQVKHMYFSLFART